MSPEFPEGVPAYNFASGPLASSPLEFNLAQIIVNHNEKSNKFHYHISGGSLQAFKPRW